MHTSEEFPAEAELFSRLDYLRAAPKDAGRVHLLVRRPATDQRELPGEVQFTAEDGVVGDRWAKTCSRKLPSGALNPDSQITITGTRLLELLTGDRDCWPLAGDNLMVDLDLSEANLPAGQRLRIGDAVVEVTPHPHLGCAKFSRRFGPDALRFVNSEEGKTLRLRGLHVMVVTGGRVRLDDVVTKI
ncbi:MOSC domain-containing protein [bacterium]|nr:MOSC domain-containing protein [bacterium]